MTFLLYTAPKFWVSHKENSPKIKNGISSINQSSKRSILSTTSLLPISKNRTFAVVERAIDAGVAIADYNTRIRHFCDVGNLRKAMELLSMAPKSDLELMTYCMVLQLCANRKSVKDGRKVHSVLNSNGVEISGILGTKLVFMYVSCGDLKQGRLVFDNVANEKVFLWNLMMSEYTKIGAFDKSVEIFKRMRALDVELNSHSFTSVLKCLASLGSVEDGEGVHGCAVKMGLSGYNNVANAIMAFYFKVGMVESACKVFDGLSDRDVVSWNSMISGCVANGLAERGLEMFEKMLEVGIGMDVATLVNVLVACTHCGLGLLGRGVHSHVVKYGNGMQSMVNNVLLDMYCKCGDLISATQVFDKMTGKTVVSWTSMMAGFAREGLSHKVVGLFHRMEREGVKPDEYTVTTILHACALDGSLKNGRDVHDYIRRNSLQSSLSVHNTLIDMYAKCGSMEDAEAVFDELQTRRDLVSWNAMIGGYSKNYLPNNALDMFVSMQRKLKPDGVTLACVLPACASLAALEKGREIHGYGIRNGLSTDIHVANALIDMYVKCGALVLARSLFETLPVKNLVSWTVMIAGYGMHGLGREAIETFNQMQEAGVQPDEVSFISILYACSHSRLLDEGHRVFNIMRHSCKIEPKLEQYACMVDMLARAGKLTEAYNFIQKMPIEPDATIWGGLLCGCRIHHDVHLAEKVAEHIFRLEPENTGYYVLLANIYAEAKKWEEVKKLRERIGKRGLKKNPGCSWIDVKGKVEIFVAGDDRHPQKHKIDVLLKELRAAMKQQGMHPSMKYALIDANEFEKEAALCRHSEKLAMAFGILNLPPGKTIRVIKNLRVCGDCHETAKFMSKTTKREIILRDSNRFHHFKDGNCSCRGYW